MKQKLIFLLLVLCIATTEEAFSQMAKFKALFLYNFTQNVEWPPSASNPNEFVITVIGDKEMATELEKLAQVKKVGTKTIVIKQENQVKNLEDSHVIFLSAGKSSLMSMLSSDQDGKPALLISSKEGLCSDGAAISFTTVDGKLRYEICSSNIEKHGLKVNNKLLSLGIPVN
nr:YfiR family protein [uncultured Carboxylicivirga sp.]